MWPDVGVKSNSNCFKNDHSRFDLSDVFKNIYQNFMLLLKGSLSHKFCKIAPFCHAINYSWSMIYFQLLSFLPNAIVRKLHFNPQKRLHTRRSRLCQTRTCLKPADALFLALPVRMLMTSWGTQISKVLWKSWSACSTGPTLPRPVLIPSDASPFRTRILLSSNNGRTFSLLAIRKNSTTGLL